jgi:hypothetical protein
VQFSRIWVVFSYYFFVATQSEVNLINASSLLSFTSHIARNVVGWFGFKSDRDLALRALSVAAKKNDVHATFAALTLLLYKGYLLQLPGWQADRAYTIKEFQGILSP